jgi:hypothetical protein
MIVGSLEEVCQMAGWEGSECRIRDDWTKEMQIDWLSSVPPVLFLFFSLA